MHSGLRKIFGTEGEIRPLSFPAPVFIIGLMRSGTTFLADILSNHPQLLKIGFELRKTWTEIGGADCIYERNVMDEKDVRMQYANNMVFYYTRFIHASMGLKRHLMRWKEKSQKGHGRIFYDWDNVIPLNKLPHFTNRILYLHKLFPESKIIYIIRSIEGHSSSMKVHFDNEYRTNRYINFFPEFGNDSWTTAEESKDFYKSASTYPDNFRLIPEMWMRLNHKALSDLQSLPTEKYKVLNYEDLFQNPEKVLPGLFQFIGTDKKYDSIIPAIASKKSKKRNTTTQGNPLEKWHTYMTEEEKTVIDQLKQERKDQYEFIKKAIKKAEIK